jgi:hypothetical protein
MGPVQGPQSFRKLRRRTNLRIGCVLSVYSRRLGPTGNGYQGIAVELKDGRFFDQVIASEGCIIEVRGYRAIPFAPEARETVVVNHKRWNFRDGSDIRIKCRAATA